MLPAERLECIFRGERPDKVPWFADLTYWYGSQIKKGILPLKYQGDEGRLRLYKELGCGAHEELYLPVYKVLFEKCSVKSFVEELENGEILKRTIYYTPIGVLEKIEKYSPVSFSTSILKYPVSTVEDLRKLIALFRDIDVEYNVNAFSRQSFLMKLWKGWGIVSSLPPRTPFARMVVEWAGALNTFRLYWRYREVFEEVIEEMIDKDDVIYDIIKESPAKFVYFGENLSSDIISPPLFKKYFLNYYRKRSSELHSAGKLIYVHIDGRLKGLLSLIAKSGVDCAQSLTPWPAGDLKVEDFRKEAKNDKLILWGGVPGIFFSVKYSEKTLKEITEKTVKIAREDGKFIIGVADQVPPDGVIERVKLITKIVEEKGVYE